MTVKPPGGGKKRVALLELPMGAPQQIFISLPYKSVATGPYLNYHPFEFMKAPLLRVRRFSLAERWSAVRSLRRSQRCCAFIADSHEDIVYNRVQVVEN